MEQLQLPGDKRAFVNDHEVSLPPRSPLFDSTKARRSQLSLPTTDAWA
ncbi:hypothetical protein NMG29_03050 [Streptomyces cocklensis]|jgi:hypothetical protein|uniref:Uncharacterized protein n=1 Tax=Actinacidiphila cocklensis TaxID=887465 RepID=A0A9W4DW70_9ACTN|nr:hypothetical protein [Actinacidiphila cocklensis]MDD1057212.1 hypothetical protein [Actinacidiphila cocklensis]WSX78377.1 hypothetical protein OH826_33750 [Streptomyces sp. NBC_00899]CAG6395040.1 hypothetical protein SCOCK_30273 [Actinacidiphila cocklensis]